jgi:hypothetical protein
MIVTRVTYPDREPAHLAPIAQGDEASHTNGRNKDG